MILKITKYWEGVAIRHILLVFFNKKRASFLAKEQGDYGQKDANYSQLPKKNALQFLLLAEATLERDNSVNVTIQCTHFEKKSIRNNSFQWALAHCDESERSLSDKGLKPPWSDIIQ